MNPRLYIVALCLSLLIPVVVEPQNPASSSVISFSGFQEGKESERSQTKKESAQEIFKAIDRLKRAVNGKSTVKNQCQIQGNSVEVQEKTEVTEADGCNLIVKTVRTTSSSDGRESCALLFL